MMYNGCYDALPVMNRRTWGAFMTTMLVLSPMVMAQAGDALTRPNPDLQQFIDDRVAAGDKSITVPPGQYRVTPRDRTHLVLKNLTDIEIDATGVELICTESTRAITIDNCSNLTLRGLTIDYDPLIFTQGRIVAMSADQRVHEIELFDGYPPADQAQRNYQVFSSQMRELRGRDYFGMTFEPNGERSLRAVRSESDTQPDPAQVGDLVVMTTQHAPNGSIPHTIMSNRCVDLKLDSITIYAAHTFAYFETYCDNTTYLHCKLDRRPAEIDLAQRGDARLRSGNADAFHSKFAVRGPKIIECLAQHMGDDAVNICGNYHMVMQAKGNELRVLAMGTMNIATGDPIEIVSYDGRRLPDAIAKRIEPDGSIMPDERAFLLAQRMDKHTKEVKGESAYRITLDREIGLPMGSVICSLNHVGRGFVVKGNTFGHNRSRAILIKGSDGVVEGNTIVGSKMNAVLVSPEYWWMESGSSNNVRIIDNTIRNVGSPAINVIARGGSGAIAPAGAHSGITITGNGIDDCTTPAIFVSSTDGLKIERNTGTLDSEGDRAYWLSNTVQPPAEGTYPPVVTVESANETVRDNDMTVR
jgi:hypothetical protein